MTGKHIHDLFTPSLAAACQRTTAVTYRSLEALHQIRNLFRCFAVKQPFIERDEPGKLIFYRQWCTAFLPEQFPQYPATFDPGLDRSLKTRTETGKNFQFQKLEIVKFHSSDIFFDSLVLRLTTNA